MITPNNPPRGRGNLPESSIDNYEREGKLLPVECIMDCTSKDSRLLVPLIPDLEGL